MFNEKKLEVKVSEKLTKIMYILGSRIAPKDSLIDELNEAAKLLSSLGLRINNSNDPEYNLAHSTRRAIEHLIKFMSSLKNDDIDIVMKNCISTIGAFDLAKLKALTCTGSMVNRVIIDFCDTVTKDLKGGLNAAIKSNINQR